MSKKSATATTRKPRKSPAARSVPTHDEIALRAYHIYLQRNGAPGSPFEDWSTAERQLLEESGKPKERRRSKVISIAA
jgi:hypothetical protein